MRLSVFYSFLLLGVIIVFYFSWIPEPRLGLSKSLPGWISRWTDNDANMNLRTAIPFVFLGLVAASWLLKAKRLWYWWVSAWLGLVTIVVIAEAGQLLLPRRHFDWGDIAWGAAGSAAGMLLLAIPILFIRLIKTAS
ncbi:hypothetical protein ACFSUS_21775 [Spirosoma soli]|uniref:VanZ family protein n=1 Tax=Spirosoma soli TaxID=1770529 RepID=A0ABW5M9S8_9BACT